MPQQQQQQLSSNNVNLSSVGCFALFDQTAVAVVSRFEKKMGFSVCQLSTVDKQFGPTGTEVGWAGANCASGSLSITQAAYANVTSWAQVHFSFSPMAKYEWSNSVVITIINKGSCWVLYHETET